MTLQERVAIVEEMQAVDPKLTQGFEMSDDVYVDACYKAWKEAGKPMAIGFVKPQRRM